MIAFFRQYLHVTQITLNYVNYNYDEVLKLMQSLIQIKLIVMIVSQ